MEAGQITDEECSQEEVNVVISDDEAAIFNEVLSVELQESLPTQSYWKVKACQTRRRDLLILNFDNQLQSYDYCGERGCSFKKKLHFQILSLNPLRKLGFLDLETNSYVNRFEIQTYEGDIMAISIVGSITFYSLKQEEFLNIIEKKVAVMSQLQIFETCDKKICSTLDSEEQRFILFNLSDPSIPSTKYDFNLNDHAQSVLKLKPKHQLAYILPTIFRVLITQTKFYKDKVTIKRLRVLCASQNIATLSSNLLIYNEYDYIPSTVADIKKGSLKIVLNSGLCHCKSFYNKKKFPYFLSTNKLLPLVNVMNFEGINSILTTNLQRIIKIPRSQEEMQSFPKIRNGDNIEYVLATNDSLEQIDIYKIIFKL